MAIAVEVPAATQAAGPGEAAKAQGNEHFKAKEYFAGVTTLAGFVGAANNLRSDYALLPESERRGEFDLELTFLAKQPDAMKDVVADYTKKIKKRESLEQPLKWSYKELVKLIADEWIESGASASQVVSDVSLSY